MKKLTKLFGLMIFASTLFTGCDHDAPDGNSENHNIEDDYDLNVNVSIDADEVELSDGIWDVLDLSERMYERTFSSGIQAQEQMTQRTVETIRKSGTSYVFTAKRGLFITRYVLPENTSDTDVGNARQEIIDDMISHDEREGGPGFTEMTDGTFLQETEYLVSRTSIRISGKTIIEQDIIECTEADLTHDDTPEDLLEWANRDGHEIKTNSSRTEFESVKRSDESTFIYRFKKRL